MGALPASSARDYVTIKFESKDREAIEFAAERASKTVQQFVLDAAKKEAIRIVAG